MYPTNVCCTLDDGEQLNDLIDDNPIDSDNDSEGSRKRKKSDDEDDDDFDDRLEEDDYDLLEENLGVKVKRVSDSFNSNDDERRGRF